MLLFAKKLNLSEISNLSYDVMPYEVVLKTKQPNRSIIDFLYLRDGKGQYDSNSTVESLTPNCEKSYKGNRYNGKRHGEGILVTKGNYIYEGGFDQDEPYGFGTLTTPDKSIIKGYWVKGKLEGFGSEKWSDGSFYEGEFKNGLKDGQGTYRWNNSLYYKGQWKEDQFDGKVY